MKTTRIVILLILLLIAATVSVVVVFLKNPEEQVTPPNKDEIIIENAGNGDEKSNLIKVSNPKPNQFVTSPLTVQGEARGTWYFEADFPVYLYDENENLLVQTHGQAQGEWMTEDFVPFSATLTFEAPDSKKGYLVLEKSNPSDLPENSDQLRIPVRFR